MDDDNNVHNIFALSDYSLIHIFEYVSSTDLYNLSLTCKRFEGLVKEKKLWHKIDARDGPNNKEKVKYCIKRMNKHTTDFLVCSDQRDIQVIPDDFFTSSACANLTILALENQLIRGDLAKLSEYPKTLVELSLRKSFVLSYSTFFKLSHWTMENLKVLILDECGWVETYMMVQMSKYPKLEILSLFKCKKLSDNDIAYLSLAGCFGFKQLRIMDLRFTGLGDQILKAFYKHPTLQELYFQSYISTYKLDKTKRLLEIARGSSQKPHAYFSDYDDVPDTHLESMQEFFGNHIYKTIRRQNLTNNSVVMYKFVVPNLDNDYEVKSVLYKSPYSNECTCGYGDRFVQQFPSSLEKTKRVHKSSREEIIKLKDIIKKEKYKKCSPYLYILTPKLHMDPYKNKTEDVFYEEQASLSNKQIYWINMREPVNQYEMAMFEHTDIHSLQTDVSRWRISSCIGYDPGVILGAPGPKLVGADADNGENLSDSSGNEDGDRKHNNDVTDNVISLDDSTVVVEGLFESVRESDEENDQLKTDNLTKKDSSEDGNNISGDSRFEKDKFGNAHVSNGSHDFEHDVAKDNRNIEESRETNESTRSRDDIFSKNNSKQDNSTSTDECNRCNRCGVKITDYLESQHDEKICNKCKDETKSTEGQIIRLQFTRTRVETVNPNPIDNNEQDKTLQMECNLPSTSKTEGSTSSAWNKRRCDNSYASTETKKPKISSSEINDEDRNQEEPHQDDLNISYELDDLNVRLHVPNRVYINVNVADEGEYDGLDLNAPMERGLINILLGVDHKTQTSIKKLSLRGFPEITDCALDYLATLKLDLLDITRTGVTRCGVRNFIRQNPTCRVLHESACVCQPDMHF